MNSDPAAEESRFKVLLYDGSGKTLDLIGGMGDRDFPFSVVTVQNADEAEAAIHAGEFSVLLLGCVDGGRETFALLDRLHMARPHIVSVIIADPLDHELVAEAIVRGANDWIPWVPEPDRFRGILEGLVNKLRLQVEPLSIDGGLREEPEFCRIIGSSSGILGVLKNIRMVLGSDVPVIVYGETGTGKELVAKALHYRGPRRKFPFKAINCASIPEALLESELFGHERGAFTGAVQQRKGKFELAHNGTLFLDEIGEMSPAVQAKLLRVIEEQKLERVGGNREINVNVRLIRATNKDLSALTKEGKFREDLFYRLAVFKIHLPPLRERRRDIPDLVEYFRARYSAQSGRKISGVSREALRLLSAYDWPGNVRELQNSMRRAILVAQSKILGSEDFDLEPKEESRAKIIEGLEDGLMRVMVAIKRGEVLPLDELEGIFIRMALDVTNGNVSEAAEKLGISRSTIYRKVEEHGIPVPRKPGGR